MSRLWVRCRIYSDVAAVLNGPAVGKALIEVTGRPAMWSRRLRGWCVLARTAADVLALCEHRGYVSEVYDYRAQALVDVRDTVEGSDDEPPELDLGLGAAG